MQSMEKVSVKKKQRRQICVLPTKDEGNSLCALSPPGTAEINKNGRTVFLEDFQPWFDKIPGRMSSIYTASELKGKNSYVFVHDAERRVE